MISGQRAKLKKADSHKARQRVEPVPPPNPEHEPRQEHERQNSGSHMFVIKLGSIGVDVEHKGAEEVGDVEAVKHHCSLLRRQPAEWLKEPRDEGELQRIDDARHAKLQRGEPGSRATPVDTAEDLVDRKKREGACSDPHEAPRCHRRKHPAGKDLPHVRRKEHHRYRHRGKGYGHPAPLHDAQRAIRMARANATPWNLDPTKIGIIGFSAGGHLVSTVITQFDSGETEASDPVSKESSRPDFAILCYPVISMGSSFTHRGSEINLLGPNANRETLEKFASERNVRPDTPPTFLMHTLEDKAVPPQNSLVFYQAMVAKNVPGELHIYQKGTHGIGLGKTIPGTSDWPLACQRWLHQLGMVKQPSP